MLIGRADKEAREREAIEKEIMKAKGEIRLSEKKLMNRVFIRSASLQEMQAEKAHHNRLTKDLRKLEKKLSDRGVGLK